MITLQQISKDYNDKPWMRETFCLCKNCFEVFSYREYFDYDGEIICTTRKPRFCPFCGKEENNETDSQEEHVKSSDFYPCADENGMVGK